MREIDEMDMLGFLRIRSWKARQDQARHEPVPRYIDEVWPNLKPGRRCARFFFVQRQVKPDA